VGNPNLSSDRSRNDYLNKFFEPAAFVPNAMGAFGNAGRNILIGPGSVTLDVALFKNIPIKESKILQLRFEFFNIPNKPNFGRPISSLTSPLVGKILSTQEGFQQGSTANNPRIIQIGAKFNF
jgi:hypothetical protein